MYRFLEALARDGAVFELPPNAVFDAPAHLERVVAAAATDAALWRRLGAESLKTTPATMAAAAIMAAVARVDAATLARALALLLGEASLVVVAQDGAAAGDVALGLVELLHPLRWRGALVMALPGDDAEALLGAPVPVVAGCSDRVFATVADVGDVHVLRLGDTCTLSEGGAPPRSLVAAFGACACAAPPHIGWVCDASTIAPARAAAAAYINDLIGDLGTSHGRYGLVDRDTGEFEFVPDWFLAPREAALASAKLLAHTQMLCSFVAERRSGE